MKDILNLMFRLAKLKETARAGWNMPFPAGHRFKTRRVEGAESVADHSWGLAMFALLVADLLGLDALKIVWMALVHDVAELKTLDIVTATLDPEEQRIAVQEKKILEEAAMHEIFLPMGAWGQRCYDLWREYADQSSAEARVLKQIDKLEACIQAVMYRQAGHRVEPDEFFDYSQAFLQDPEFVEILKLLRERAMDLPPQ